MAARPRGRQGVENGRSGSPDIGHSYEDRHDGGLALGRRGDFEETWGLLNPPGARNGGGGGRRGGGDGGFHTLDDAQQADRRHPKGGFLLDRIHSMSELPLRRGDPMGWENNFGELSYFEYWCQVTFRSSHIHITAGTRLADTEDMQRLHLLSASLEGPTVYCLIDAELAVGYGNIDLLRDTGQCHFDFQGMDLQMGNQNIAEDMRNGTPRPFLLCKVALGRTLSLKAGSREVYPPGYGSILVDAGPSPLSFLTGKATDDPKSKPAVDAEARARAATWYQIYRVKSSRQVLPMALIDIVYQRQKVAVPSILCDVCGRRPAVVYCTNDDAHFCAGCDATHHSENEFFARHQRFGLEHSPKQFGTCVHHPTQRYELICLDDRQLLCRSCIQLGPHASKEHAKHKLMSTLEAFKGAMKGTTASDKRLEEALKALTRFLQDRHLQMTDLHNTYEDAQLRLDQELRDILEQLTRAQARKVEFLQSVKRQVLSQMLFVQWLEGYLAHARLALPPADFVIALRRHEWLLSAIFAGLEGDESPFNAAMDGAVIGPVPTWIDEELVLRGNMSVSLMNARTALALPGPEAPEAAWRPQGDGEIVDPGAIILRPGLGPSAVAALVPGVADAVLAPVAADGTRGPLVRYPDGVSYVEATLRGKARHEIKPFHQTVDPSVPQGGSGGLAEAIYATPRGAGDKGPCGAAGTSLRPGQRAKAEQPSGFDGYLSQAFAYLDEAERKNRGEAAEALAAPRKRLADLQLATEVLVLLRSGAEEVGGPAKPWGTTIVLVLACPNAERQLLMLQCLKCALPVADTAAQMCRAVVEDDVHRAQVPSLLASASSVIASLAQAMVTLVDNHDFLQPELSSLVRNVSRMTTSDAESLVPAINFEVGGFLHSLSQRPKPLPSGLISLCHYLYNAAEVKFGVLSAQNAVVMMLLSRIVTPVVLRVAQRDVVGAAGLGGNISELSRLLQRIAHFAHHGEDVVGGGAGAPVDLPQVLQHVGTMREFVSRILVLPADNSLGVRASAEDAEDAANWIVDACRHWKSGMSASGAIAGTARPRQQQLLDAARPVLSKLAALAERRTHAQ